MQPYNRSPSTCINIGANETVTRRQYTVYAFEFVVDHLIYENQRVNKVDGALFIFLFWNGEEVTVLLHIANTLNKH